MSQSTEDRVVVVCPGCGKELRLPASARGRRGKCPACQTVFQIPLDTPVWSAGQARSAWPSVVQNDSPPLPDGLPAIPVNNAPPPIPVDDGSTFPDLAGEPPKLSKLPESSTDSDFFGPEKKGFEYGVLGGVVMMVIAVVWFVGGLMCDYIFFYPPVLFIIGMVALIKGLATGNLAGNKPKKKFVQKPASQQSELPWD